MEESEQPTNDTKPFPHDPVALHQVLKNGTKNEILELLQQKIDPNCVSENGDTVLHEIMRNEKLIEKHVIEIINVFLTQGINPNIVNKYEQTVLHLAVERRMKDAVNFLLKSEADIHTVDDSGNSIAHFFIKDEYEKCKGAMRYPLMNTKENWEMMENNSVNFLYFLMSKNVDIDLKNKQEESALHLAITYQLLHILPTLLELTNDAMFINRDNKTLLHLFLEGRLLLSNRHLRSDHSSRYAARIVGILLDRGVPILASDKYGCTLISDAVKRGEERDIIEILINHYLNSCNEKDVVTSLFNELMSTCALWSNSDTEYFLTVLSDLVTRGANVNSELPSKRLVLTEREAKNAMFLYFLKGNGINFSIRSRHDESLLHMLAEQRDYQGSSSELYSHICDLVFSGNCEVNTVDERGKSVLQTAVGYGNVPMARILIELGADVNNRDDTMGTPLHDAVMGEPKLEMVDLLLSNGADVNAQDHTNETPLYSAVSRNNASIVRLLLEHGAFVGCENKYRQTPLHRVIWQMDEAVEIVDLLLSRGADANAKDDVDETPLHLAVAQNNVAAVLLLLQHGASVSCRNKYQETPLHCVRWSTAGAAEIVELLLTNGADVNAENSKGEMPLNCAFTDNSAPTIRLLLQHGASVSCKDKYQQTPLHRALATNATEDVVKWLLTSGADVNAKDYMGKTPLHEAVSKNNVTIARLLLQCGAHVNCKDNSQQTPLHRALTMDAGVEMIELLVKSGADVNAKDHEGNRPLHHVFQRWALDDIECILKILLERGAYVNARNSQGESVLFHALSMKNRNHIDELLKYNADLNDPNVRSLMLTSRCQLHQHILRQQLVKLKTIDLLLDEEYRVYIDSNDYYQEYQNKCLKEVEKLKSTIIGNDKSLYDFLHMQLTRRVAYTVCERLQQLMESPRLHEMFPEYSVVILASYRDAVTRKSLWEPAERALRNLTQVRLPDLILTYLSDVDLINVIDAHGLA